MVAATGEGTGGLELLQKLPLVWGEDQKELHPLQVVAAGLLLGGVLWICMHLLIYLEGNFAGFFEGRKLKERRWENLKSFLLTF